MHRASPTLLVLATCLAGSLLTPSPAAADDTGSPSPDASSSAVVGLVSRDCAVRVRSALVDPVIGIRVSDVVRVSLSPSATEESPFGAAPSPFAPSPSAFARPGDTLVTTNVVMAATAPGRPALPATAARQAARCARATTA